MTKYKEKDIVKHIVQNWDNFFPDLTFRRTELKMRDFRVDIFASFYANLKDLGVRDQDYWCHPSVFFEVKYNSNMRDLMFELQKQINFRNWYVGETKAMCVINVISDDYNADMVKFMQENNIYMFKISMEDDDIETLKIKEYLPDQMDFEDIKDILLEG